MDESQRVLFARLLCSSQLSHFGDVMVFISRPVERGGGSPWKPSSRIWEQRQHSAAPARETGCNVTPAQDPDSCYDPKHNLFRVWPAPTVNNHSRRVECQPPDTQCVKTRSGQSFTYKNTVQAAKLCRKSQWEVYLEQTIRNRSHPEVFSEGLDPVFPCCHKKKDCTERERVCSHTNPSCRLSLSSFSCQRDQETFPSTLGFCFAEQSSANKRCIVYLLLWGKIPALEKDSGPFWSYPGGKMGHHFPASRPPQMDRCMLSLCCRWWENIIPSVLSWRNTGLSFRALQNSSVVIN